MGKCWFISPQILALRVSVPDLHFGAASLLVLLEVDVDGEMGVDVSELVEEALGDTDDEVVKDRPHGSESGNIFPGAVVDKDGEGVGLGLGEGDRDVAQVLGKLSYTINLPVSKPYVMALQSLPSRGRSLDFPAR